MGEKGINYISKAVWMKVGTFWLSMIELNKV